MDKVIFRVDWKYRDGFGKSSCGTVNIKASLFKNCPSCVNDIDKLNSMIKETIICVNSSFICDPNCLTITNIEDLRGDISE